MFCGSISKWNNLNGDSCDFYFQAEDGIRDLVRSCGLGDVYKRQLETGLVEDADTDGHVDNICAFLEPGRVMLQTVSDLSLIHI